MAFVDPQSVVAPRKHVSGVRVIFNGGPNGYSLARLSWDDSEEIGIRWNGADDEPGMGNPQSRAHPTWFLLPRELAQRAAELAEENNSTLAAGYREMALDQERETEAWEWSEGLIEDGTTQAR